MCSPFFADFWQFPLGEFKGLRNENIKMFSTLSSYIWASEQEDQTVPDNEIQIETKEQQTEDEWVLVDVVINPPASEKSGMTKPR